MSISSARTRCFNRELTIEMIVGTFIASVFIVLVAFTIVISGSRLFQGGRHSVEVVFDNVGSLRRHDSVLMRGVQVGKVDRLQLFDGHVRVKLALTAPVKLRDDYRVRVEPSSLLGGNQLIIEEGTGEPLPPDTELQGESPGNLMEDLGRMVKDVRGTLDQGGVLTNIQRVAASLAAVSGRLERGEGTLGKLLSSDDQLYTDLAAVAASLRGIGARLEKGEGTLGKLLSSDDQLYHNLDATVASLKEVTGRLQRGEGSLGKLLSSDDRIYQDLQATIASLKQVAERVNRGEGTLGKLLSSDDHLYADLAATAGSLREITGRVAAGEGTLGRLLSKDDALYGEIEGLVKDARVTLDDLRESTPVTTFASIFLGVF